MGTSCFIQGMKCSITGSTKAHPPPLPAGPLTGISTPPGSFFGGSTTVGRNSASPAPLCRQPTIHWLHEETPCTASSHEWSTASSHEWQSSRAPVCIGVPPLKKNPGILWVPVSSPPSPSGGKLVSVVLVVVGGVLRTKHKASTSMGEPQVLPSLYIRFYI